MVKLKLSFKAELQNVTDLKPASDDFEWFVKVKCGSCHETHPNEVAINRTDEREMSGSRGTANFVWKCSFCKRESSASFDPSIPIKPYTIESNEKFAPLAVLDCRGLELVGFSPKGVWTCKGTESSPSTIFDDVELEDGEWTDYDEKGKVEVSIMNIEARFDRA